jgi:hypothetical protein
MSNTEITASLRITCDPDNASRLTAPGLCAALGRIGGVSTSKGESVLVVDLDVEPTSELDKVLDRSITAATSARELPGLPGGASITAWFAISSSGEFVGVSLPEDIVKRAAAARVSLVFSVYACQSDLEAAARS